MEDLHAALLSRLDQVGRLAVGLREVLVRAHGLHADGGSVSLNALVDEHFGDWVATRPNGALIVKLGHLLRGTLLRQP